jgi:Zn-finger domain-containing protein
MVDDDDDDVERMWSKRQLERLHWEFYELKKGKGKRRGSFDES